MLDSNWNETCPHCGTKVDVYSIWSSYDNDDSFRFECPKCAQQVACDVITVPEFELGKPACAKCRKVRTVGEQVYCDPCREEIARRTQRFDQCVCEGQSFASGAECDHHPQCPARKTDA